MLFTRYFLTLALLAGFLCSLAQASLVWRPGEGWSDESGGGVSASSSADQLELARKLESEGKRDDALKAYKELIRRWPLSFSSPEAQYRIGKIQEDEADFLGAFKAFQKMVEKYPSSSFFTQALEEQYRIANLYLAGEPQKIWKIPIGPSMEKTVEMYKQVIKNAPYGPYSAQCQFNIGLANEKQRKYIDAVDAYQKVLEHYPGSDLASNAQYQIGYAWMRSSSAAGYDQSAAQKAVESFQDFVIRYPDSDKVSQAQENIQKLSHRQTQGSLQIAQFYETQHNPRAAYIYYNEVVRDDPNSPQAVQAKKRIQELRPVVEAMPGGFNSGDTAKTVASANPPPSSPTTPAPTDPATISPPSSDPLPADSSSTLPVSTDTNVPPAATPANNTPTAPTAPVSPENTPLPQ